MLVTGMLILSACGPQPTPTATAEVTAAPTEPPVVDTLTTAPVTGMLTMLDWSGYELPEFWSDFAVRYPDVNVEFSFMSESADSYAKMKSGF